MMNRVKTNRLSEVNLYGIPLEQSLAMHKLCSHESEIFELRVGSSMHRGEFPLQPGGIEYFNTCFLYLTLRL